MMWSLLAITMAVVAIIAAHMAQREADRAIKLASAARLAILSSRASRNLSVSASTQSMASRQSGESGA